MFSNKLFNVRFDSAFNFIFITKHFKANNIYIPRLGHLRHQLIKYQGLGYTALKLNNILMRMLADRRVQETLPNMIKYSAKADEKGSTFVFQEGIATSTPVFSKTRLGSIKITLYYNIYLLNKVLFAFSTHRKMMYLGYDFS